MNAVKTILFVLLTLTLSPLHASKRLIKKVPCHQQGPNECGFYALLHGLEELLNTTLLARDQQKLLKACKQEVSRENNLNDEDIRKLAKKFIAKKERKHLGILANIDEAKDLLNDPLLLSDEINTLGQHFIAKEKVIILLQTRNEAKNKQERNSISHWIMLGIQRVGNETFAIIIKDSTDPDAQATVSGLVKDGIDAVYDYFKYLLKCHEFADKLKKERESNEQTSIIDSLGLTQEDLATQRKLETAIEKEHMKKAGVSEKELQEQQKLLETVEQENELKKAGVPEREIKFQKQLLNGKEPMDLS